LLLAEQEEAREWEGRGLARAREVFVQMPQPVIPNWVQDYALNPGYRTVLTWGLG